jgi:hypothetical protein
MADDIMTLFLQMAVSQKHTNLLNVYKGVPLSFSAKIVEVGDSYLRVLTDTYQMVSMYLEKKTLIQAELLPEIVQAEVIELNPQKRMAVLANFSYVERGIGNRTEVRIQPRDPLTSEIQDKQENISLQGELADISRDGLGVYLDRRQFSSKLIYPEAQININLELPEEYLKDLPKNKIQPTSGFYDRYSRENIRFNPAEIKGQKRLSSSKEGNGDHWIGSPAINITATVVNIHLEKTHNRYRIGMRILPTNQSSSLIARFISQRQSEIIQEIRELYQLIVNPENSIPKNV